MFHQAEPMEVVSRLGSVYSANPRSARVDELLLKVWPAGPSGPMQECVIARDRFRVKFVCPEGPRLLNDDEVTQLCGLALRVVSEAGGLPQRIDWQLVEGVFRLSPPEPIADVEFTWDEDVDGWQPLPDDDDTIWTLTWSEEFWDGALTPLHYSVRGEEMQNDSVRWRTLHGFPDIASLRLYKYSRGAAYYNTKAERLHYERILARPLRPAGAAHLHPDEREDFLQAPFDAEMFVRTLLRIHVLRPESGILRWFDVAYSYIDGESGNLDGPPASELRGFSDDELKTEIARAMLLAEDFNLGLWDGFYFYTSIVVAGLRWILETWVGGDTGATFQDLVSGLPARTRVSREIHEMWELAEAIRRSPSLRQTFDRDPGGGFFDAAASDPNGPAFLAAYSRFLDEFGHRGHADRDMYYDRRSENPNVTYLSLRALLLAERSTSPEAIAAQLAEQRIEATERVLDTLRSQPIGALRAHVFSAALSYLHRFLVLRDDQRWAFDKIVMAKKRAFQEVGRRAIERGLLHRDDDFYFLARHELYEVLDGKAQPALVEAKLAARRRSFEAYLRRDAVLPVYLRGGAPLANLQPPASTPADEGQTGAGTTLAGVGTSRGTAQGRARVIRNLEQIGALEKDEILVCHAADPGWAPFFPLIKGLIIETGGFLSASACLAREYGLPVVALRKALRRIEDGTLLTIDGSTGSITTLGHSG